MKGEIKKNYLLLETSMLKMEKILPHQKALVILDDQPLAMEPVFDELKKHDYAITVVKSFRSALLLLDQNDLSPDGVIIDLRIPVSNLPTSLEDYADRLDNHSPYTGQLLGFWLEKHMPTLPFIYMSLYGDAFDDKYWINKNMYKGKLLKLSSECRKDNIVKTIENIFNWG